MYESLKANSPDFHLYIFAFDDLTYFILKKLSLQNVTLISLNEFETPELLSVKSDRSKAEYCWTCTPSTISYVIHKYKVSVCTYIDSDLIFYSDPSVLIKEMIDHNKNVLITEHRFSLLARLYEKKRAGRFCVQFVTFSDENNSLEILEKWRMQCIDWCYARYEENKFGDQKYLDEWPDIYNNVHILMNPGGGIAPWNVQKYKFYNDGTKIIGNSIKSELCFSVVFYHFQYVKLIDDKNIDIGWYNLKSDIKKIFYQPYLKKIIDIEAMLKKLDKNFRTGYTRFVIGDFKSRVKIRFKALTKYNIMKTKYTDGIYY